ICLRCLEKDPGRRYGSAEALAEDLGRFVRGEPIAARPVGRLERSAKWVRRNPVVAALLAAVVGVAAGGLGAFAWAFGETLQARDNAITDRKQAEADRKQAEINEKKAQDEKRQAEAARKQKEKQLLRAESLLCAMQIQEAHNHLLNHDL